MVSNTAGWDAHTWAKQKTTSFTVNRLKFVVCPFVYKETKRSYPFANGLNGLAHL
jgi:hypothetical protein